MGEETGEKCHHIVKCQMSIFKCHHKATRSKEDGHLNCWKHRFLLRNLGCGLLAI